jgi:SP family sugar:H+ symporter-like MFS transporter
MVVKLLIVGGVIGIRPVANAIMSSLTRLDVGVMVLIFASLHWFAFSWGPVVWLCLFRDVPYRHRGKATGLTTMTNWASRRSWAVCSRFSSASLPAALAFFAVLYTLGTIVVYFFQVETAKKTSPEIDEAYQEPQAPAQAQGLVEDVKQEKATTHSVQYLL